MNRIQQKLLVMMLMLAMLFLMVLWTFHIGFMERAYITSRQRDTANRAQTLGEMIDAADPGSTEYIANADEIYNTGVIIINKRGVVIYKSRPFQQALISDCVKVFYEHEHAYSDYVEYKAIGQKFARSYYQLKDGRGLFLLAHVAEVGETVSFLQNQFYSITMIVVLTAVVFSLLFSQFVSSPIKKLDRCAANLSKGDLNTPIISRSQDEIGHLAKTLEYLRQSLKREDKLQKELIGNVSHELKTPMAIIRGFAETVRDISYKDEQKRTRHLDAIIDETNRLTKIVDDIMDYSQMQSGVVRYNFGNVDLKAVIAGICNLTAEHFSGSHVELISELEEARVWGDETKLSQVVFNLIANAFNHSPEGRPVHVRLGVQNGLARFSVIDQGEGIPQAEIENIWNRHYRFAARGREERMGSGLGLAIVKTILEAHKAQFGVNSKEGEGSEFYFCLPVQAEKGATGRHHK